MLAALLSGLIGTGPSLLAQSIAPVNQEAAPTAEDYEALLKRLDQAERHIESLTQQQSVLERLPAVESQLGQINDWLQLGGPLNPNVLRSTDIHPLPPSNATPSYPSVRMTGFFQLDAGFFAQDAANTTQFGKIKDDIGFRRARLAAVGDVADNVSYMIEMDFAFPGRPSFMDVFVDIHDVPVFGNLKFGQWRQPFGLDNLTSVRELTFLERPLMFGMSPFRQTGIGFHDNNADETVTWAGSAFGYPTDAWGNSFGNTGFGTAERITALLIERDEGRRLLHVGIDHTFNIPGQNGVAYRNTQEYGGPFGSSTAQIIPGGATGGGTTGDLPFLYNTGALFFTNANLVNAELAGVFNSFHCQAEATYAYLDFAGNHVTVPAVYAQAGYLLTGEIRPYNRKAGVLGRIKPLDPWSRCGGWGAWEVAARYSYMDTNPIVPFQPLPIAAAQPGGPLIPWGGAVNNYSSVVNCYLNNYTKFQFEYIYTRCNRGGIDSNLNSIVMRAQVDF